MHRMEKRLVEEKKGRGRVTERGSLREEERLFQRTRDMGRLVETE